MNAIIKEETTYDNEVVISIKPFSYEEKKDSLTSLFEQVNMCRGLHIYFKLNLYSRANQCFWANLPVLRFF